MGFLKYVKSSQERDSFSSLLIFFGIICLGFVIAGVAQILIMLGFLVKSNPAEQLDLNSLNFSLESLTGSVAGWWTLIAAQGVSSFFLFIATSLVYWFWVERKKWHNFNSGKIESLVLMIAFTLIIHLTFLPFSSYLAAINEKIQLPESLAGLEKIMKDMEESAKGITDFMGQTDSFVQLFFAILVVGVIAGIGEELVFRGIIQRKFIRAFENYHVAVWVSAFIFSAIHFQFYGFLPRLALGALFGYLYVWSGNIWVPIAAHIFNNTLAVILLHLVHKGLVSPELEKMDSIPLPVVLVSTLVCVFLLLRFYKSYMRK